MTNIIRFQSSGQLSDGVYILEVENGVVTWNTLGTDGLYLLTIDDSEYETEAIADGDEETY